MFSYDQIVEDIGIKLLSLAASPLTILRYEHRFLTTLPAG